MVAVTGWWCNTEVKRAIENQLSDELESMISADVTALEIWISNQLRFVSMLASEEKISTLANRVLEQAAEQGAEPESLRTIPASRSLQEYVSPRLRSSRLGFVVLNPDGVLLSAPFPGMVGDQLHDEALEQIKGIFEEGEPVLLTPYHPPRRGRGAGGGRGRRGDPSNPQPNGQGNQSNPSDGEGRDRSFGPGGDGGHPPGPPPEDGRREPPRKQLRPDGALRGPGGPTRSGPQGRRNRTIMAVGAPLFGEDGNVIAAIGLMIQPDLEFTRILSVARSGDSGETYAFDANGFMLSQSRFEEQLQEVGLLEKNGGEGGSALNLELRDPGANLVDGQTSAMDPDEWPLTRIVAAATSGEDGVDVSVFRDYRGVPVVGAWRWLPEYQFGVATKLDAMEAFQPLRVLRLIFLILLLLAALAGVGMFLFTWVNVLLRRQMEDVALEAKELGQYTLEKKIGEGGMGAVYRARHALLRRDTAVKLLLPEKADENSVRRFEREVQLTCRLGHPNTIQIFDYGHTPDGIFYYAMEYLDGINLRDLVKREGKVDQGRVIHILRQVCASLQEAHEAGLVHRDIKPANVILCDRGGVPDMVKVLDFGLVKAYKQNESAEEDATQTLSITGTPQFIAPESVSRPDLVDQRSDLYSVGALAYYLLIGEHVFDGESAFEVMQHHVSTPPVPPAQRTDGVDQDLELLVLSCLEKQPDRRPSSAHELNVGLRKCRAAQSWTEEERRAWWKQFRTTPAISAASSAPTTSSILEPTLQINLDNRTRVV